MALFPSSSTGIISNPPLTTQVVVTHYGYVCDRCGQGPIKGIRYKCLNCNDYDLCSNCEELNLHDPKHLFLKIRNPLPAIGALNTPLLKENLYDAFNALRANQNTSENLSPTQQSGLEPPNSRFA